jgi:hypothetical protein
VSIARHVESNGDRGRFFLRGRARRFKIRERVRNEEARSKELRIVVK